MVLVEIKMKNGLLILQSMDGMFKLFGLHFLAVAILMLLIELAKGIL